MKEIIIVKYMSFLCCWLLKKNSIVFDISDVEQKLQ